MQQTRLWDWRWNFTIPRTNLRKSLSLNIQFEWVSSLINWYFKMGLVGEQDWQPLQGRLWTLRVYLKEKYPKPLREIWVMSLNNFRGRWHDFVVHAVWSPNSNGLINVWLNSKKIYCRKGKNLARYVEPKFKFWIFGGRYKRSTYWCGVGATPLGLYTPLIQGNGLKLGLATTFPYDGSVDK